MDLLRIYKEETETIFKSEQIVLKCKEKIRIKIRSKILEKYNEKQTKIWGHLYEVYDCRCDIYDDAAHIRILLIRKTLLKTKDHVKIAESCDQFKSYGTTRVTNHKTPLTHVRIYSTDLSNAFNNDIDLNDIYLDI